MASVGFHPDAQAEYRSALGWYGQGKAGSALILTVAVTLLFALAGGGIAALISAQFPSYYPAVFPNAASAGLDPQEVGLALGITQGIVAGLVFSLVLLALAAWRSHRGGLQAQLDQLADRLAELELELARMRQTGEFKASTGITR